MFALAPLGLSAALATFGPGASELRESIRDVETLRYEATNRRTYAIALPVPEGSFEPGLYWDGFWEDDTPYHYVRSTGGPRRRPGILSAANTGIFRRCFPCAKPTGGWRACTVLPLPTARKPTTLSRSWPSLDRNQRRKA